MDAKTTSHTQVIRFFEALYRRYHKPVLLRADPLVWAHKFETAEDQEVAALFGALLAYGNVKQINASLENLFTRMEFKPADFIANSRWKDFLGALKTFRHRFSDGEDIATVCWLVHKTKDEYGSLENAFLNFATSDHETDYAGPLTRFVEYWGKLSLRERHIPHIWAKPSLKHLLPDPSRGSACKRWFLFLRWVVRPRDGIDLGLWCNADPAKLLFPVDRHVLRIGNNLGISHSRQATLKTSREITQFFRSIDRDDPTRFDFALCHMGILRDCPVKPDMECCAACELRCVCRVHRNFAMVDSI